MAEGISTPASWGKLTTYGGFYPFAKCDDVLEAPRADADGEGMAVLAEYEEEAEFDDRDALSEASDSDSVDTRRGVAVPGLG